MSTAPVTSPTTITGADIAAHEGALVMQLVPRQQQLPERKTAGPTQPTGSASSSLLVLAAIERQVGGIARSIAQASIEVLGGTRPIQQLSRSLSQECFTSLQHRAFLTRSRAARDKGFSSQLHRNPHVRSARVCAITEDICEATLVVAEERRSRAVAMRLERDGKVWRVTALEIG
jgi:hypothetical protein